jgi:hypothetical protein
MNKPGKCIACAVMFWIIAIVADSLFWLFSAWAMSELGPAQQEAIAAINTPWMAAQRDPALAAARQGTAVHQGAIEDRSIATSITTKR